MFKNLKKPICFIDLETTGLSTENDRIVEITICKKFPDGTQEIKTKLFNPEIPISPDATALHGFTDEDVKNEKPFSKFAKSLCTFIEDSDLAGYGSNRYDFPLLNAEFQRAGVKWDWKKSNLIDIHNILVNKEPRTLAGAYQYYLNKELENSHSSKVDILATVEIFEKQIEKYDLPIDDVAKLALLSNYDKKMIDLSGKFVEDKDGDLVINFGTHKGKKAKTEIGFLEWMLNKDFSEEVKEIINEFLETQEKK